jgi:transposase
MCPYQYYAVMRRSIDKKTLRHQMVVSVEKAGIKETARVFHTTRNTVRKWHRRWCQDGYAALADRSRRPKRSPLATAPDQRRKLLKLKKKYKRLGAEAIKTIEGLPQSPRTIRKIWRQQGVSSRKRRKKHQTKQNLREVKKLWALFEQICEDTKDLTDIPEYWTQMKALGLPRWQYTAREVTSGLLYMGFAQERSLTFATLFAQYLNESLRACGADLAKTTRQTDNGSEYVGSWNAKGDSAYTKAVQSIPGQNHYTIPPGAHRFQADVETVHNLVEMEFYEIETFHGCQDFLNRAYSYQLFFNLQRPNSYKENKTPWQIAQEKNPQLPKEIATIPPVFLEDLLDKRLEREAKGGHDVYSAPYTDVWYLCS